METPGGFCLADVHRHAGVSSITNSHPPPRGGNHSSAQDTVCAMRSFSVAVRGEAGQQRRAAENKKEGEKKSKIMCKRRFEAESWIDLLHKPTETMIRPVSGGAERQKKRLEANSRACNTSDARGFAE